MAYNLKVELCYENIKLKLLSIQHFNHNNKRYKRLWQIFIETLPSSNRQTRKSAGMIMPNLCIIFDWNTPFCQIKEDVSHLEACI